MNIALLAHDDKKELMIQFCIAYRGILAGHALCSTGNTGALIAEATGLRPKTYLNRAQGGIQQIGARIACNEIDLVIFLCDASGRETCDDANETARLCDRSRVPFASNIATAEVLIRGLNRGDPERRETITPKN